MFLCLQIGPIFLPPRLNGDTYLRLLQNDLPALLHPPGIDIDDLSLNKRRIIFQQDGAPAHYRSKNQ